MKKLKNSVILLVQIELKSTEKIKFNLPQENKVFLKSLEVYGFKSFADRTKINFADGITALLGPNGCGKSNVVDAIKWVLAENKSKNLRAASMEDVIFNGTETRPALSVAEVTLTIANENGLLPLQDSEIAIKRRLYRSGEGEYFINGKQVTATEIRRLFMDTGVGKAAYSVMEQGKIDQILSSKPEDRRYLFEEAAGISRSKAEVAEAERNLEKTRQNLNQIETALQETKRNYETLKVQAEKTAKFRKFQEEKFNCELDLQLLKLKDFTLNKSRQQTQKEEAEEKRDKAIHEIQEIYESLHENTEKINSLQTEIVNLQQEVIKISTEQSYKKETRKKLMISISETKEKISSFEAKLSTIEERIDEYNEEIDSQTAEKYEKQKQLDDINKNIQGFLHNLTQASGQIDENEKQEGINGGKIRLLDEDRSKLQKKLEEITEDIVTELDAKLKDAGYSSAACKKSKEEMNTLLDKIKIFANGRLNIFKDFTALNGHSENDSKRMGNDGIQAFEEIGSMLQELTEKIEDYTKKTPQFIDDFLSPEGIITQKRDIDNSISQNLLTIKSIQEENEQLRELNKKLNEKIKEYQKTVEDLRVNQAAMAQQITACENTIQGYKKSLANEQSLKIEIQNDLDHEISKRESFDEELQEIDEAIADLEKQGQKIADQLIDLDNQIKECNNKVSGKNSALEKKQAEQKKYQDILEKLNISLIQSDTEIKNIKQNFQDNYSRNLMEFEERMYKISATSQELKEKLGDIKKKIEELGGVNHMAVEMFAEEKDRYERQQANFADTQKSLENLVRVSEEIRAKSTEIFLETYNKIKRNFHNMFRRLFSGGKAELKLLDPANVLTSGIEIYAQPPGKKLQAISLLSGGEKTMTAVALLFATYQVRPSPFCLLDEIDAALDDKNVTSFVQTLRAFANVSQYIVITHNKKTVMGASTMLGVTMEESGITKVVQTRLDDATLNARLKWDDQSDFVEEDVPPEEGIVIPPRPPKRLRDAEGKVIQQQSEQSQNIEQTEQTQNSEIQNEIKNSEAAE